MIAMDNFFVNSTNNWKRWDKIKMVWKRWKIENHPRANASINRNRHQISQFTDSPISQISEQQALLLFLALKIWFLPGLNLIKCNVLRRAARICFFQVSQYPKLSREDFSDTIVCERYLQTSSASAMGKIWRIIMFKKSSTSTKSEKIIFKNISEKRIRSQTFRCLRPLKRTSTVWNIFTNKN